MQTNDYNKMFDYLDKIDKEKLGSVTVLDEKFRNYKNFKFRDFYAIFCSYILKGYKPFEMYVDNIGIGILFDNRIIEFAF